MPTAISRLRSIRHELRDARVRHMLLLPFTLPFTLRRFFRERLTVEQARARLRSELENREARFLELARSRIYTDSSGPYARLLRHAGCEPADLEESLRRDGLEKTLERLATEGVYLTPPEFKGKEDVVRGGLSFRVRPEELEPKRGLRRGGARGAFVTQSSGTSNRPVRSVSSLAWHREETAAVGVFLEAHGLLGHRHAAYEPMIPGAGIVFMMMMMRFGVPLERWFARPVPTNNWLEGAYFRVTAAELARAGRWFGPGFAGPQLVPAEALHKVVRWVEEERRAGRPSCIRTVASNAARIARVANELGASLEGCTFIASGEPLTVAKRRVIRQAGAAVTVLWGYDGTVYVGFGCARPAHGDEMHVLRHTLAVVEHPQPIVELAGDPVHPLLFTTLYPTASRLQLNVSNGDYAVLSERSCGCALEQSGLTLHVHGVGSYEKLTSEGLAYSYDELFELLETALPDEFGGGAGDYQILEEEDLGGQTYLTLLVDPAVGPIDERGLLQRLASALAEGSRGNRFMAGVWGETGTLRVRREAPLASARGKILPLRVARKRREDVAVT
jgi:hypothetical protein